MTEAEEMDMLTEECKRNRGEEGCVGGMLGPTYIRWWGGRRQDAAGLGYDKAVGENRNKPESSEIRLEEDDTAEGPDRAHHGGRPTRRRR